MQHFTSKYIFLNLWFSYLILGNIYEILSKNLNKSIKQNKIENYYFYLLEKQYSWKEVNLK